MASLLKFGSKFKDQIMLCDYCRYYKCDWIKATPKHIHRQEFERRIEIVKKTGVYLPNKKKWRFSIRVAEGISGDEFKVIIDEIISWSEKNNFKLTDMIRYEDRKWF